MLNRNLNPTRHAAAAGPQHREGDPLLRLNPRARRALFRLSAASLALWGALEWLGSRPSFILRPFGLIAYFASASLCLALSIVLFAHSPRRRLLSAERIAAAALLIPLLWNLL